ncbi:TonB-dependent receptor domain-containing protein [Oryzicola mucosus]|uniref:TonB-dependent receptor n=1 Tax=Oryzicola mucosus TaxID=2767425 RepID=A0A8J6U5J8_9HYPH|nr:TonB-dependent receptor [Oryzicola mucosus]MBD0416395.1 TonB-dependent receptor [Oryzicola mucosus]
MGPVARNLAVLMSSAAVLVLSSAHGANAQETRTTEEQKGERVTVLQRIVITAGREKVAIDTPSAVTVVNQEDIEEKQPQTINEIIKGTPGVNATGSDRLLGQSFNIRGIGAPENTGDGGRIIVNVDGAQKFYEQYRLGSFFSDPELYKRVEILRGPAFSTLYGSGALGGVINFETKDASDYIAEGKTGALRMKTTYDSNGNGWLASPLLAQKVGENAEFLLTGNYRRANNFKDGDGNEVIGTEFRAWSGLAKGTFKVGDEGTLRVSYQRWDSDLDRQELSQTSTATMFGLIDRHIVDDTAVIAYENPFSDYDLLDVKFSASYSRTKNNQDNHVSSPAFPIPCIPGSFAVVCDSTYAYETWQFNAQNTFEWRGDNWENFLTVGSQTAFQNRIADAYLDNGMPFPVNFHPEGKDVRTGIFAQNEFIWNEKLTLIPGIRLDWRRLTPGDNVYYPETTNRVDSSDDTAFSPKIAAHYKINDTIAVFGSLAHTERFPTLDEVFSTTSSSSSFAPSLDLKKERSNNIEGGFALSGYDLVQGGDAGELKLTAFHNSVKGLIALNSPFAPGYNDKSGFKNINNATIYGFEVEAAYDTDYFFANAGYSYVVGKNDDDNTYLQTVAPHELSLTVGAKIPDHGMKIGWRARFVAGPQDSARDTDVAPMNSTRYATSFDVHDMFVTWKPEEGQFLGWEGRFGIDNIFDRQYKEFLQNDVAKGRTFKLTLAKQLDW